MKNLLITIIALVFIVCACNPTYTNKKLQQAPPYLKAVYNLSDTGIYVIDASSFKEYVKANSKKHNVIVSYTYWCPASKQTFDTLVALENDSINVFFFTAEDWYYIDDYRTYLRIKQYTKPSFILDINTYGKKFNPHPKYKKFFAELSNGQMRNYGGFPSYLILNRELDYVYGASEKLDTVAQRIITN
jgi:hypothetical protein